MCLVWLLSWTTEVEWILILKCWLVKHRQPCRGVETPVEQVWAAPRASLAPFLLLPHSLLHLPQHTHRHTNTHSHSWASQSPGRTSLFTFQMLWLLLVLAEWGLLCVFWAVNGRRWCMAWRHEYTVFIANCVPVLFKNKWMKVSFLQPWCCFYLPFLHSW